MAEPNLAKSGESDQQPTIAVDFDGVIANYDGWTETSRIGAPREDVVEALTVLRGEGWKIVVYSCRGAEEISPLSLAKTLSAPKNDAMPGLPWREEPELDQDLLSGATLLLDGNVRARTAYM